MATSAVWKTGCILHWSTVYTTGWTPWSLSSETRKSSPQGRRVLRPVDGDGGGDDVLVLFPRYPTCGTRSHRWEDATQRTMATCTLISARNLFLPTYAHIQNTPVSLVLLLVTPQSFSHPFFHFPSSSAHLSTFNPLARSRSSARPSRS